MQLRYSFRVYPSAGQRTALARAFGCARVVFNDALRVREEARRSGLPFVTSAELSTHLMAVKKTPERAWLGEVSAVILQQSLRDLDTAYRNFFDGLKGKRPRMGAPRFTSKRDNRQSIRFTANAAWRITPGGKLRLPKIGDLKVKWSRTLPSAPSTVTVVKGSAGRYVASFVVETDASEVLPQTTPEVGIDLGLGHFAVLSDGTKVDSPRFLRRAEKRLKKAQRALSRRIAHKGEKAPIQASERWHVERTHAWQNAFHRLARCYERRATVANAFFDLADTIITVRSLIRQAWTTHRWDHRPKRRP
ncbi:transposase [Streptomyces sp. NPDC006984]|uniref:RNA-guided endonuclease InsQ/TnpB family protein n=1 Tax=Streptomyces sp. NPDC006984 TaxID=3155463 RepID=UPI0034024FA9